VRRTPLPPPIGRAATPASPARRSWLERAFAATLLAGAGGSLPGTAGASPKIGQPAPPLVLHALDGRSIATSDLAGSVVLLAFWATWCVPCREELPLLSRYAVRKASLGLQVLGFSLNEPEELTAVRRVAAALSFPVGLLGSAWAGGYGRIWRLPVTFTIDRRGRLADNTWDDDQPAWTEARLQRVVAPLLEERS
jgi:cytochrome c biogenesis protein CcmG/thiol:disulfide interchange protein DsbE